MLCREKKVLYIHVPKCGGTFIEQVMVPGKNLHELNEKHLSLAESIELYGKDIVDECYKFSIVRNPFSRMVSAYLYYLRHGFLPVKSRSRILDRLVRWHPQLRARVRMPSFQSFVQSIANDNRLEEWAKRDLRPASKFCAGVSGVSLDQVYTLENMPECVSDLEARGFGCFSGVSKVNFSPKRYDYRNYYNDATRDLVAGLFASDFENYYSSKVSCDDV